MGSCPESPTMYLLGVSIRHSLAPAVHNFIATILKCDWKFEGRECPSIEDALTLIRRPNFVGAIVTMPYKKAIMGYLDDLDGLAIRLGACNVIYTLPDGTLRGTNTDWIGVAGCLLDKEAPSNDLPALIIGAGGACRAAIHALATVSKCKTLYVVNCDEVEVRELKAGVTANYTDLGIVHVISPEQAKRLQSPYYIISTIPDTEPTTQNEKEVYRSLEVFLSQAEAKGFVLDMCYKPRRTRVLKLAEHFGWNTIEGTGVIGHQLEEQYRLWLGKDTVNKLPLDEAWQALNRAAESNPEINL